MTPSETINFILDTLSYIPHCHSRAHTSYHFLDTQLKKAIENRFGKQGSCKEVLNDIGNLYFPYFEMGTINSTHLFGLDELIIFAFYKKNAHRYKNAADMGANIGLHSIILSKLGYKVGSYEPDPRHLIQLKQNINCNCQVNAPTVYEEAISTKNGSTQFTRVVGNTTGSHISGAKKEPYGELESFDVTTRSFKEVVQTNDLLKIDVEGHEAEILCTTTSNDWSNTDAIVEVGSQENAARIYHHFRSTDVNLFSQSMGWKRVQHEKQMPCSYKDGSLFISRKSSMPWS